MSAFWKKNEWKWSTSRIKTEKKFSVLENFMYQRERKVSRILMLKANQAIR